MTRHCSHSAVHQIPTEREAALLGGGLGGGLGFGNPLHGRHSTKTELEWTHTVMQAYGWECVFNGSMHLAGRLAHACSEESSHLRGNSCCKQHVGTNEWETGTALDS